MGKIDLIINSKFIGSQKTRRKKELHQIDLQETILCYAPLRHPYGTSLAHLVSSGLKNLSKKFRCVWTPFGIDFMQCKKTSRKQQLALGTTSIG